MSVTVFIDGQSAAHFAGYLDALAQLGPVPDESQQSAFIWTRQPQQRATSHCVWLNPPADTAQEDWLQAGGSILSSRRVAAGIEDCLFQGRSRTRVRSRLRAPIDPAILAAFLAHDFPLVDALMLARAYRGGGWPNDLSHYPEPVGGPQSPVRFAQFLRHAGLYAVVPASEWVRRLAEAAVPVLQLRNKCNDAAQRAAEMRRAIDAVARTGALLFINDDWQLAIEHNAYGVHLGQQDIQTADLRAVQQSGLRLGISTHGIYEMLRAHACKPSYIALGAIYVTSTKSMPTAPQGLRRLRHYVHLMSPHYPLVAIGGIDLSRIAGIWATGVDCAAVLRAIVDAPDYRQAAASLLAMTPRVACGSDAA